MNKIAILIAGAATCLLAPVSVQAAASPSPTTAAAKHYTTGETTLATLAADPAAKAILDKRFPGMVTDDIVAMAGSMTIKSMQQFKPEVFTDGVLAELDGEFAKLPNK